MIYGCALSGLRSFRSRCQDSHLRQRTSRHILLRVTDSEIGYSDRGIAWLHPASKHKCHQVPGSGYRSGSSRPLQRDVEHAVVCFQSLDESNNLAVTVQEASVANLTDINGGGIKRKRQGYSIEIIPGTDNVQGRRAVGWDWHR